jgi:hypothetical protein
MSPGEELKVAEVTSIQFKIGCEAGVLNAKKPSQACPSQLFPIKFSFF